MSVTQTIKNPDKCPRHYDRSRIQVADPSSYRAQDARREAFETRAYYEYVATRNAGGFVCFLTFTYNNKSMPVYLGEPCFSYDDIRSLTNGAFFKKVKRSGYDIKYLITKELGEGKGKRGIEQNPHYHVLFFIKPIQVVKSLTPNDIMHLAKMYWMTFDDAETYADYRYTGKGIVKPGKFGVEVTGVQALKYCCKYTCKSIEMNSLEQRVHAKINRDTLIEMGTDPAMYASYLEEKDNPTPFDCVPDAQTLLTDSRYEDYLEYISPEVKSLVHSRMCTFRREHGDMPLVSNGFGIEGLKHIDFSDVRPTVPKMTKNGPKNCPLCLYYYRKVYMEVTRDYDGNVRYVLTPFGQELKKKALQDTLKRVADNARVACDAYGLKVTDSELDLYATYNVIYKYRKYDERTNVDIDPVADYSRFIVPSTAAERSCRVDLERRVELHSGYVKDYMFHPVFKEYVSLFDSIDGLCDAVATENDERLKKEFEENMRVKRQQFLASL